jgi:hypothetical protein
MFSAKDKIKLNTSVLCAKNQLIWLADYSVSDESLGLSVSILSLGMLVWGLNAGNRFFIGKKSSLQARG